uniref:Uncharacterized protein n=1 Tax=Oryzias latipes TaxID=8090 RepID=A0A286P9X5_ORYLA|nr:hypothetical protein [Oryzias latipes]
MDRWPSELIDDPQWVSHCVEEECAFDDRYIPGCYVCSAHLSKHSCSGFDCALVRAMAARVSYASASGEFSCPVVGLAAFRREDPDFRGPWYSGTEATVGYGALEVDPRTGGPRGGPWVEDQCGVSARVLKSCLPAMIALFSTVLTREFADEYRTVERGEGQVPSQRCRWTSRVFRLAGCIEFRTVGERVRADLGDLGTVRDAALKSAAAVSTLFCSPEARIKRFVKKMVNKQSDKHSRRDGFYTLVIMASLCFFPYLKLAVLSEMFDNRTLVLMFFDKTLARHNQWSMLSTNVHLHVKRPQFQRALADADPGRLLPLVVRAALDDYVSLSGQSSELKCLPATVRAASQSEPRSEKMETRSDAAPEAKGGCPLRRAFTRSTEAGSRRRESA